MPCSENGATPHHGCQEHTSRQRTLQRPLEPSKHPSGPQHRVLGTRKEKAVTFTVPTSPHDSTHNNLTSHVTVPDYRAQNAPNFSSSSGPRFHYTARVDNNYYLHVLFPFEINTQETWVVTTFHIPLSYGLYKGLLHFHPIRNHKTTMDVPTISPTACQFPF